MKKLKSTISLGIITALTLFSLVFPLTVSSASVSASVSLSSMSGFVGSKTIVSGQNFAGTIASIYLDDKAVVKNIKISDDGSFSCDLTIPEAAKGNHTIKVNDNSNWAASSATVTFSINPSISSFPDNMNLPGNFTVYGHGFNKTESDMQILIDGKSYPTLAPVVADATGAWAATVGLTELDIARGRHNVTVASGAATSSDLGQLSLIIGQYAEMKPASGPVGTQLLVYGWGFRQNEDGITLLWDEKFLITNIRCGTDGVLTADGSLRTDGAIQGLDEYNTSIFVPPACQGSHTIVLYGSDFSFRGTFPDFHFVVTPSIQIQPLSGITGVQIDLSCTGFAQGENLTVKYDGTQINTGIPVDKNGSALVSFNAPKSTGQNHIVSVVGNKGNSLQAKFITTDVPEVTPIPAPTPAPTPTPTSPNNQNPGENQTSNKLNNIEYLPPSLNSPSPDQKFFMFNSVGDVFAGFFRYLANIGSFFNGNTGNSTNAPDITFQWSDTNKISNPGYVLDLSRDGQFSDIVVEEDVSSNVSYKLPNNIRLSAGSYFWRVKTVDSQGNESNWSSTSQFTIGSTPGQVTLFSIVISILILAAIIFAIFAIRSLLSNRNFNQ